MNIDEKINSVKAYMETLAQQIKSIEARHKELTFFYIHEEGKLAALTEIQKESEHAKEAQ